MSVSVVRRSGVRRAVVVGAGVVGVVLVVSACSSGGKSGGSSSSVAGSASVSASGPNPNVKPVNVLVIQTLTGPGAVDGQPDSEGSQMAADAINAAGGIKSLGGAKINVIVEDAGGTTDTAVAATQLGLSKASISVGMGAELSSQTLAMEPVWTRAKVPWIAGSVADTILQQGSTYTFRESASTTTENQIIPQLLVSALKSAGKPFARIAFAADNTAAPTANLKGLGASFPAAGSSVVFSQQWTPPLADAVGLAEKVKAANPDIVYSGATASNDIIGLRKALVAAGVTALDFGTGVPNVSNAFLTGAGAAANGFVAELPEAPVKEEASIAAAFQAKYSVPFTADAAYGYEEMYIAADGLEAAKSADPQAVRDALSTIDISGSELPTPWVAGWSD
jgi:branched-chain amino acid transport system substrate-binding protein